MANFTNQVIAKSFHGRAQSPPRMKHASRSHGMNRIVRSVPSKKVLIVAKEAQGVHCLWRKMKTLSSWELSATATDVLQAFQGFIQDLKNTQIGYKMLLNKTLLKAIAVNQCQLVEVQISY